MFRREQEQSTANLEAKPGEVVGQYQEVLNRIIGGHEQVMARIVQSYEHEADRLQTIDNPSPKQIDGVVQQPGDLVTKLTGDTTKDLETAVGVAAKKCPKVLSGEDSSLLSAAQAKARQVDLSVSFWQVDEFLNAASSREARSAMWATLDNDIWKAAQAKAQEVDLSTSYWKVDSILMNASSLEARAAMKAAIDKEIWHQAQGKAQQVDLSVSYWQVDSIIQNASSGRASHAFKASVDSEVWKQAKTKAAQVNLELNGWQVSSILNNISSRKLRSVMEPVVMQTPKSERHTTSGRKQAPPFGNESPNFDFDDMLRDMFRRGFSGTFGQEPPSRGGQQRGTHGRATPPPHRERPQTQESSRYQEVDNIVRKTIAAAPDEKWLARADKAAIQRVVNSVKNIREKAKEKGETVTDRQIYIMYRRKVEIHDLDEATKQRLTASTQIMLALMGGKTSGKLPF